MNRVPKWLYTILLLLFVTLLFFVAPIVGAIVGIIVGMGVFGFFAIQFLEYTFGAGGE